MNPDEHTSVVPEVPASSLRHGVVKTADFEVIGDIKMAYLHLKEMYEPKVISESGPIKPLSAEELAREKQKPQEEFVNSLDPTTHL